MFSFLSFFGLIVSPIKGQECFTTKVEPISITKQPIPLIVNTGIVKQSTFDHRQTATDYSSLDSMSPHFQASPGFNGYSDFNDHQSFPQQPPSMFIPPFYPTYYPSNVPRKPPPYELPPPPLPSPIPWPINPPSFIDHHSDPPARSHVEEIALFLVVLTIAGLFGLLIAMFIPFILLLRGSNSQSTLVPGTVIGSSSGVTPGIGRRRKRDFVQTLEILKNIHELGRRFQD